MKMENPDKTTSSYSRGHPSKGTIQTFFFFEKPPVPFSMVSDAVAAGKRMERFWSINAQVPLPTTVLALPAGAQAQHSSRESLEEQFPMDFRVLETCTGTFWVCEQSRFDRGVLEGSG